MSVPVLALVGVGLSFYELTKQEDRDGIYHLVVATDQYKEKVNHPGELFPPPTYAFGNYRVTLLKADNETLADTLPLIKAKAGDVRAGVTADNLSDDARNGVVSALNKAVSGVSGPVEKLDFQATTKRASGGQIMACGCALAAMGCLLLVGSE